MLGTSCRIAASSISLSTLGEIARAAFLCQAGYSVLLTDLVSQCWHSSSTIYFHASRHSNAMYAGGVQELHAAYHEAVSAIFEKRVACHRHQRCYTSKKTGKQKWTTLEMWPIAV